VKSVALPVENIGRAIALRLPFSCPPDSATRPPGKSRKNKPSVLHRLDIGVIEGSKIRGHPPRNNLLDLVRSGAVGYRSELGIRWIWRDCEQI
jgi:hypothetical protein